MSRLVLGVVVFFCFSIACADESNVAHAIRATTAIRIDGDLSDETWQAAPALSRFYEVYPGDHTPPPVETEVKFAFDDHYVYIGAHMHDPAPAQMRTPFVRRDRVGAGQDYVQFFIDPYGTRRYARVFRINVRSVQTDGSVNEATGTEDDAPDFPFDVATRRVDDGWEAELRIPWSSLRYPTASRGDWAIMAYRGWPRSDNTQIASGPVARSASCFLCFATTVQGFETPASERAVTVEPEMFAERSAGATQGRPGADFKWQPAGGFSVDATLHPDFSELEADAPQVTGNARYSLQLTEKRAFFLESADLLETPLHFVYTRAIADPLFGARVTSRGEQLEFTGWGVRDDAGAELIRPGPYSSGTRILSSENDTYLARARLNLGRFSVAVEGTDRRADDYRNTVGGADASWQFTNSDRLAAQWLTSETREGAIDSIADSARQVQWEHWSQRFEWLLRDTRMGRDFRADAGFLPTADFQEHYGEFSLRWFDTAGFNELRPYVAWSDQTRLSDGALISRGAFPAAYFQAPHNIFGSVEWHFNDHVRANDGLPERETHFVKFDVSGNPLPRWPKVRLYGNVGRLLDIETGAIRPGYELSTELLVRPLDRLEIQSTFARLRLTGSSSGVVAAQDNSALTAIWHFNAAMNVRIEWIDENIERNDPVRERSRSRTGTVVAGYRPNLGTTAFLGVSRIRESTSGAVAPSAPWKVFVKLRKSFAL
jgi:hypothetical protein